MPSDGNGIDAFNGTLSALDAIFDACLDNILAISRFSVLVCLPASLVADPLYTVGVTDHLDIGDLLAFAVPDDCPATALIVDRHLEDTFMRIMEVLLSNLGVLSCLCEDVHLDECRSRWHDRKRRWHPPSNGCFKAAERAEATSAANAALEEPPYSIESCRINTVINHQKANFCLRNEAGVFRGETFDDQWTRTDDAIGHAFCELSLRKADLCEATVSTMF